MSYLGHTGYQRPSRLSGFASLFVPMMALGLMLAAFFGFIAAIPIYFLWNWLMPDLFGITTISYWQAWGIYLLTTLLFKGYSSSSSKD